MSRWADGSRGTGPRQNSANIVKTLAAPCTTGLSLWIFKSSYTFNPIWLNRIFLDDGGTIECSDICTGKERNPELTGQHVSIPKAVFLSVVLLFVFRLTLELCLNLSGNLRLCFSLSWDPATAWHLPSAPKGSSRCAGQSASWDTKILQEALCRELKKGFYEGQKEDSLHAQVHLHYLHGTRQHPCL